MTPGVVAGPAPRRQPAFASGGARGGLTDADRRHGRGLPGAPLQDASGEVLGTVSEVYVTPGDDTPAWAAVDAGTHSVVVPLLGARMVGGGVRVRADRDRILAAPEPAAGGIAPAAQEALHAHYDISDAEIRDDAGWSAERPGVRTQGTSRAPAAGSEAPGHP